MAYKVFLDVNVFLDFFLKRQEFSAAKKILRLSADREIDAYASSAVLQTVSFYLQKYLETAVSKKLLLELLPFIKFIEPDKNTIAQALTSTFNDIEDAIHYFSALKGKMDYIVTSDIDFQKSALSILPVLGINEFIEELG